MGQLLSNFGKQGAHLGLFTQRADIEDKEFLSKYFVIAEFDPVLTAGRNPVSFNGSSLLKNGSEIQVECLDSAGNSLYIEQAKATNSKFSDVANFVISIHVYDETYNGHGKLVLVGTTVKNEIVRWIGNITIDKTLTNASKVRFYNNPTLDVRPLLYPVVDVNLATITVPPPPKPQPAKGIAIITNIIDYIHIINPGSGYTVRPTVTIPGATAEARILNGIIVSIDVINPGSGYTSPPSVIISGTSTTPALAETILTGIVASVTIIDHGIGYTIAPLVKFSGIGSDAYAATTIDSNGSVDLITVINGGRGYTIAPTVTFETPPKLVPVAVNVPVNFNSSFYAYAVNPPRDTNKMVIDKKRLDVDYRLVLTNVNPNDLTSSRFPLKVFNTQMEGKSLTLNIDQIQLPFSYDKQDTNITASYVIKKVIDSKTVMLDDAFYYTQGKDQILSDINRGTCDVSYRFILYNTQPESNLTITTAAKTIINVEESYAEITYRNLKTYSGFVARHKLYRRSLVYPGDFQLISDEPLGAIELLSDPVTFNKAYDKMGTFYHQNHIDKYWFTSSNNISVEAQNFPINSMRIDAGKPPSINGTEYVMVKNDSIGVVNDNVYYPYDTVQFNDLSGKNYNSNFIDLKKDALYVLSTNVIVEKDATDKLAKIAFYFTSSTTGSTADIRKEKDFDIRYGLKLGEIYAQNKINVEYFKEKQMMFFTPSEDYFGTIIIVPYHCNVTLSEMSLKVYGDYGFSPDILFIKIPFLINVKNEAFELKAELFDINHNLIFSNLKTTQIFDPNGESLYSTVPGMPGYSDIIGVISVVNTPSRTVTVSSDATHLEGYTYLPDLSYCSDVSKRFVAWQYPVGNSTAGLLCYTNVSKLIIDRKDYISLSSYDMGIESTVTSLAIRYDGANNVGKRIYVDPNGVKFKWP